MPRLDEREKARARESKGMLGGVRETRVVDSKSTRGGMGWASRRSSQPQPRWFTNAVLQIRCDVGRLWKDKYRNRKQDNAFRAGAGAWSMAVVTAAAEKERESAQVVYMYVHVCPCMSMVHGPCMRGSRRDPGGPP